MKIELSLQELYPLLNALSDMEKRLMALENHLQIHPHDDYAVQNATERILGRERYSAREMFSQLR